MIIQEFIAKYGITMQAIRIHENPHWQADPSNKDDIKWHKEAGHFSCALFLNPDPTYHPADMRVLPTLVTYYSMGRGNMVPCHRVVTPSKWAVYKHKDNKWYDFKDPEVSAVLDTLSLDSSQAFSFEDWCAEFGYDPDSRRVERIYNQGLEDTKKLKAWLGAERFHELCYEVERL